MNSWRARNAVSHLRSSVWMIAIRVVRPPHAIVGLQIILSRARRWIAQIDPSAQTQLTIPRGM